MSQNQINTSNYSGDDYSGYINHKFSNTSREHSKFGPSLNPDYFSPNPRLGGSDFIPPHLSKFKPTEPEPRENDLLCAKFAASECPGIQTNLGKDWLGIDYSDPNAAYNCFCAQDVDRPQNNWWSTAPHATGVGPAGRLSQLPSEIPSGTYNPRAYSSGDCGTKFDKYIEYSKTNATFWNTPPKTPLYRRAQTALLMYNRIRILVHGDFNRIILDPPISQPNSQYSLKLDESEPT